MKSSIKTTIKEAVKKIAISAKEYGIQYSRLDSGLDSTIVIKAGEFNIAIDKKTGVYSCFIEAIPVSFHCDHKSQYAHEMWVGETYSIKREIVDDDSFIGKIWEALVHMPHEGHHPYL